MVRKEGEGAVAKSKSITRETQGQRPGPKAKPMPDPIDGSPRELAKAIMQKPPKKTRRFLEKKKTG